MPRCGLWLRTGVSPSLGLGKAAGRRTGHGELSLFLPSSCMEGVESNPTRCVLSPILQGREVLLRVYKHKIRGSGFK